MDNLSWLKELAAKAKLAEVAAVKAIMKEREYSAWLQGECDKAVDALYKCNAEVAALRAQLHTEIEQRQFIGDLIANMPHARLAAEFEEFKAEVAAANLREEPHVQPCPCAWCRVGRDNQEEAMSELTRAAMTAGPAIIAEAAWQAINAPEHSTDS